MNSYPGKRFHNFLGTLGSQRPVSGNVCWGLGIESCSDVALIGVKGDDGEVYEIAQKFSDVSEYNERRGYFWVEVKSRGLGLLSRAMNLFSTEFYKRNDSGQLEEVSPDSILRDLDIGLEVVGGGDDARRIAAPPARHRRMRSPRSGRP